MKKNKENKEGKNFKCYFFGTFNPPHLAHKKVAKEVLNQLGKKSGFEKVIFVPSFFPPHKKTLDFKHRYDMCCLTFGKKNVSDIEKTIEAPNYTYKTIEKLGKCYFIIGYDAFFELESWKKPEYLKKMLTFIVVRRNDDNLDEKKIQENFEKMKTLGYNYVIANISPIDISSHEIRLKFKNSQSIKKTVTKKVEEYIYEHQLY